jgi:Tol biopolymer transport system component
VPQLSAHPLGGCKNIMRAIFSIIILTFSLFGLATGQNSPLRASLPIEINYFDISPDDKHIVFSAKENGSSIYIANIDGTSPKNIIAATNDTAYYFPKYSPDGKKIVFIKSRRGSETGSLCIARSDGSRIQQLTDNEHLITEAIFSLDGKSIYFCMANVYKKYSPIGRTAPHDLDIYAININSGQIDKVSQLKLYSLSGISELDSINMLVSSYSPEWEMYTFSKMGGTLNRLGPSNEIGEANNLLSDPVYSRYSKSIVFRAINRLYVMNKDDKIAKRIFWNEHGSQLWQTCPYNKSNRIMFTILNDSFLYSIKNDGTDIKKIAITIN